LKNQINIRYVTETDFSEIFCLLEQLWPNKKLDFDKMLFVFNRNLTADYKRLICAEINSKIVGFCSLTIKDNLWQQGLLGNVDELVIDEQFRCKGIGTSLMEKITEIAKQTGCVQIELDSALHRIQAHTFYRNLGFESRAYLFSKSI
jgi:glucosamine-phosphate N-acetyltransferase